MTKFPQHDRAHNYAVSQIGVYEVPMHSNHGPIQRTRPRGGVDFYQEHDFLAGGGYAWCVDFWLTGWAEGAGHPLPYKTAGAYDMLRWARQVGWVKPLGALVPGDGVVFNVGSGHLAMFDSYDASRMVVHTIDGNHDDRVARCTRSATLVAGGIHVPENAAVPPPPKPYWVIATSERGHRQLVFSKFATEKTILGLLPKLLAKYGKSGITITRGNVRKPN